MANYLEEKIAGAKKAGKFSTATGLYDRGSGLMKDLKLAEISIRQNQRLSEVAQREDMRAAAAGIAVKLNGHFNTLAGAKAQNDKAVATLAAKTFPKSASQVDALWDVRIFDYLAEMGTGAALKAMADNPRMIAAVLNAPLALPNLPAGELQRLVSAHLEKANPAAMAEIAAEKDALDTAEANLRIAENAITTAAGYAQNAPEGAQWLSRQVPSMESQAQLTREVSAAEADRLIAVIRSWDFDDRRVVLDRIMEVQTDDVMGRLSAA
jgi:hypothetical protein